jgi:hypothetical protein
MIEGLFPTTPLGDLSDIQRSCLLYLLRRIIQYRRLGVDQDEAAKRLALEILTAIKGSAPTADDLHLMRNHWAEDAFPGSSGEL